MKRNNKKTYINLKGIISNVFVLFLILILYTILSSKVVGTKHIETTSMIVSNNDTLWSIAKDISKNNEKADVQNVVISIKEINQMEDSIIYAGQTLLVPVY